MTGELLRGIRRPTESIHLVSAESAVGDFAQFNGSSEEELRAWLRRLLLNNVQNFSRRYRTTRKRAIGREVAIELDGDVISQRRTGHGAGVVDGALEARAYVRGQPLERRVQVGARNAELRGMQSACCAADVFTHGVCEAGRVTKR